MNSDERTGQDTHDSLDEAPPPPRRLLRYPDAGPGAGVAAGLGAYFGLDPVLLRIAFVLLAFAGGTGILLYILGWALIPEAPGDPQTAGGTQPATIPDDATKWVGIALVVVAALWLTAQLDFVSPPVLWAVALIVVGVLLFRGDLPSPGGRQAPGGEPAPAVAATQPLTAGGPHEATAARPLEQRVAPAAPPPRPPPPPRPRSALGRLTAGAAMFLGGGAALLDTAGVLDLTFRHYAALVLLVVGLGLLLGAWWGRARGLIAIGLLLIPVVAFASVASAFWNMRGGVGERFYAPTGVEEVADAYELFAGRLQLDLSEVELDGGTLDVRAGVTFGELVVLVGEGAGVEIDAVVGAGEIQLPVEAQGGGFASDRPVSGVRVERRATLAGSGSGTLALDLSSGFGTVTVRRAP
jgi:phage shock protein PspC (stress-responsive transcriptional regulator)